MNKTDVSKIDRGEFSYVDKEGTRHVMKVVLMGHGDNDSLVIREENLEQILLKRMSEVSKKVLDVLKEQEHVDELYRAYNKNKEYGLSNINDIHYGWEDILRSTILEIMNEDLILIERFIFIPKGKGPDIVCYRKDNLQICCYIELKADTNAGIHKVKGDCFERYADYEHLYCYAVMGCNTKVTENIEEQFNVLDKRDIELKCGTKLTAHFVSRK